MVNKVLPFRDLFVSMLEMGSGVVGPGEPVIWKLEEQEQLLLFLLEGSASVQVEGEVLELGSDQLIIVQGGAGAGLFHREGKMVRYCVITCEIHQVRPLQMASNTSLFLYNRVLNQTAAIRGKVQELNRHAGNTDEESQQDNHFLFQKLIYCLLKLEPKPVAPPRLHPQSAMELTLSYLGENYDKPVSVERLAQLAGMSRRWYTEMFKRMTSQSPGDYVAELRIGKAKELLNLTDDPLYEIARKVGYEDEHYFSRRFKQKVGASPRHYLKHRRVFGTTVTYPEFMHVLGVTPMAARVVDQGFPFYLQESFRHVEKLGSAAGLHLSQIRAARPDLILAAEWQDQMDYDELRTIAPTIVLPDRDDWREELRDMGEILNRRVQVMQVIAAYEQQLDKARESLYRQVSGKSVLYVRLTSEGVVAFGNLSSRGRLLYTELGLAAPDDSLLHVDGELLTREQLAEYHADYIILQADPGVDEQALLPVQWEYREPYTPQMQRVYRVGHEEWYNFSFSPLATQYALGDLVRLLKNP